MRMLNYATDNLNPFHRYQIVKRENALSRTKNNTPTPQKNSSQHFHTYPTFQNRSWTNRRTGSDASISVACSISKPSEDILESTSTRFNNSTSISTSTSGDNECSITHSIDSETSHIECNTFNSLYHDGPFKEQSLCFASIEDMDFMDASSVSEFCSDLSCSSSFYNYNDYHSHNCSKLQEDPFHVSNMKGGESTPKGTPQVTLENFSEQCNFPRDQRFSTHQEDKISHTKYICHDAVNHRKRFSIDCHSVAKGKFSGMSLADTLAQRRKISDRSDDTIAFTCLSDRSRKYESTCNDTAATDCSWRTKTSKDCSNEDTTMPPVKLMSYQQNPPDKVGTRFFNKAEAVSLSSNSRNKIDIKRRREEHVQICANAQSSKIDAVMKIRKLIEDAKKKNVPSTTSPDKLDNFMLVRAMLKNANQNNCVLRPKLPQDREQTLSNHVSTYAGNPSSLLLKTKLQIPSKERLSKQLQQHDMHQIQLKPSVESSSWTRYKNIDGHSIKVKATTCKDELSNSVNFLKETKENMKLVERFVTEEREQNSCQVSQLKSGLQHTHCHTQTKLSIVPRYCAEDEDTKDVTMIVSKEDAAAPIGNSVIDNKTMENMVIRNTVAKDIDFTSKSKLQVSHPSSAEQYKCLSSTKFCSSMVDGQGQDNRLNDLDAFDFRESSIICDESPNRTEYKHDQDESTFTGTYTRQYREDVTKFLPMGSSIKQRENMRKSSVFPQCDSISPVEETRGDLPVTHIDGNRYVDLTKSTERRDDAPCLLENVTCSERSEGLINRYCTPRESTIHANKVICTEKKDTTGLAKSSAVFLDGKYAQMVKVGVPKEAIAHAMMHDGGLDQECCNKVDMDTQEKNINEVAQSASTHANEETRCAKANPSPLNKDNDCNKYHMMLKMGIPLGAVENAIKRDGKDPSVLVDASSNKVEFDREEEDMNEITQSATTPTNKEVKNMNTSALTVIGDHNCNKYSRMLKMGVPLGAVKNTMRRDGKDLSTLASVSNTAIHTECQVAPSLKKMSKDMYRRTRLHWVAAPSAQNSVWHWVKNDSDVSQFKIDDKEFSDLFQLERQNNGSINQVKETFPESVVKVIDSKRANNGGIILARLKMSYDGIAKAIEIMDESQFNVEQIKGITEYLPTRDEILALQRYTNSLQNLEHGQLCECEKFMISVIPVANAKEKMKCMLFKLTFLPSINELQTEIQIVLKACNEILGSLNLRKVLGIILKVGNRLNSSGDENDKCHVDGFTIDTLSKLNQIKAFDRKTTLLFYIVSLIERSNKSLLCIKQDIPHVFEAQKFNANHDTTLAALSSQLVDVKKTALVQANKVRLNSGNATKDIEEESLLQSCNIGVFTLQATRTLLSLNKSSSEASRKFSSVLEYFAQESKIQQSMLFSIVSNFSQEVEFVQSKLAQKKVSKKRPSYLRQTERN